LKTNGYYYLEYYKKLNNKSTQYYTHEILYIDNALKKLYKLSLNNINYNYIKNIKLKFYNSPYPCNDFCIIKNVSFAYNNKINTFLQNNNLSLNIINDIVIISTYGAIKNNKIFSGHCYNNEQFYCRDGDINDNVFVNLQENYYESYTSVNITHNKCLFI
jgi:hypothetical protein